MSDAEALEGVTLLARLEGILPALESAHAVFAAVRAAGSMGADESIVVSLSGRGDKDVETMRRHGLGRQGGERA